MCIVQKAEHFVAVLVPRLKTDDIQPFLFHLMRNRFLYREGTRNSTHKTDR
jgi:hypothetical protein